MREPERLSGPLGKLASSLGIDDPEAFSFLFNQWGELVGHDVAGKCQPVSLKKGILKLRTDSPAWAGQLRYLQREILQAVNSRFREPVAKRVEVSIVPLSGRLSEGRRKQQPNDRLPPPKEVSSEDLKEASELVSQIDDEALAKAAKNAYLAGKMRQRKGR